MPAITSYVSSLLTRYATPSPSPISPPTVSNLLTRAITARNAATTTIDPAKGVTPFETVPNKFVFVVIGLIGAGFVITGIWFFFFAKNGGFYFTDNDWDDYKSTVLRRKGPNGTTISGATESTDLGGGSIVHGQGKRSKWARKNKKSKKGGSGMEKYKDFDEEESSVGTRSEVYSEMSQSQYTKDKSRKKSRLRGGDLGDVPESEYGDTIADLRAYRHEKPARVGGMNRESDSSTWDGSTNPEGSTVSDRDGLMEHRERTPISSPEKPKKRNDNNYKIRKVVGTVHNPNPAPSVTTTSTSSFWDRKKSQKTQRESDREGATVDETIKAEAKKLQEKGRAAQSQSHGARRDFSFRVGDDHGHSEVGSETSLIRAQDAAEERERERREREERKARREARRQSRSPIKQPLVPGSYADSSVGGSDVSGSVMGSEVSGDTGTKSYPCFIPGLSGVAESEAMGTDYTDDRRRKRNGGYRREG